MISRLGAYRVAGISGLLVVALALGGVTVAQGANDPSVTQTPSISGTPQAGVTVTAVNGKVSSGASSSYTWVRCTDTDTRNCGTVVEGPGGGTSYTIVSNDVKNYLRVVLCASGNQRTRCAVSDAVGPVTAAPPPPPPPTPTPAPTPPPAPTPTPTATPTPAPTFDVAPASTPVPTSGAVLQQNATSKKAKLLHPWPTVRIRGTLTPSGAHVSSLTVHASKGMTVSVACGGSGCPARRMTRAATATTHLAKFERSLRAGIRLTVKVSKPGYVSKITVLTIRLGTAPRRTDSCLYPGHRRTQKCQS